MEKLRFPIRFHFKEKIIETAQMIRTANRTFAVHTLSALVIYAGRSRLGKTTTARWIIKQINDRYDPEDENSFRAFHYEVGEIEQWAGNEMKKGIRSLYDAVSGTNMDEGFYRQTPTEGLARQTVFVLRRKRIQMVFLDEAGCLSLDAIRGMVLVRDTAEIEGWTLSLIFIGMDELPKMMLQLKQIENRIHEWVYFEPYNVDEAWELLVELHPYFAKLDARKKADREQVEFILEMTGGAPGLMIPLVQRIATRLLEYPDDCGLPMLRAIHLEPNRDKNRSIQDSTKRYEGKMPDGVLSTVKGGKG
ncbi:MAG: hypothetical protein ACR2LC_10215 [Pyrinomonadaceae bacterium]